MCHPARRQRFERDLRERESFAPDLPAGELRAGDADRERTGELLRTAAAAGRLSTDELEQRLEHVYAARTGRELRAELSDLPAERAARAAGHRPRRAPVPVVPLGIAALFALAAASGAWFLLWLIWPLMVFAPRYA